MATQFQNRLIGTVILVSLGVIFLPDLLTGKHNNPHEPIASVPLNPDEIAVKPSVSAAGGVTGGIVVATSASAGVSSASSTGVAPEGVVVASGHTEQWSVDEVADTTTLNQAQASHVVTTSTSAAQPPAQPKPVVDKKAEIKVAAAPKSNTPEVKTPASAQPVAPVTEKPKLQAGQIKPFVEVDERAPVVASKPTTAPKAAPVTSASASGSAWTIQAGVFSSGENARALMSRLRASGLPANLTPVRSGTSTMYRVTVGPDASRARLEALVPKVSQIAGTSAKIIAYSPLG